MEYRKREMGKSLNLPTQDIIHLYVSDNKPATKIAELYGVSDTAIYNLLRREHITIDSSSHKTIAIDKNELKRLYIDEDKTSTEVAKILGVTFPTILRRLREYNIPVKQEQSYRRINPATLPYRVEEVKVAGNKTTGLVICPICNRKKRTQLFRADTLRGRAFTGICKSCTSKLRRTPVSIAIVRELYEVNKLTVRQIANHLGCRKGVIRQVMDRENIKRRPKGESHKILFQSTIKNKGTVTSPEIGDIYSASEIGLNGSSYYMWVVCEICGEGRWEVKSRVKKNPLCWRCAMKINGQNHRGELAPCWRGGISFEPYSPEFNKELKRQVLERDKYTCKICGRSKTEVKLAIHHIDYNKKHNYMMNLITLCGNTHGMPSCHSKTNHRREYWQSYLSTIVIQENYHLPIDKPSGVCI